MLTSLSITNIALIDSLEIDFQSGFTVLTGETGAGKSILLDSLALVLGARAESRLLKSGTQQGSVSAEFTVEGSNALLELLEEHAMPGEDNLRLKRVIYADGKTKAFINDEPAGLNLLKKIAENLVEIHSQHEHTLLLDSSIHRAFLDLYGKNEKELVQVEKCYNSWKDAENRLNIARAELEKSRAEEDYLRHVYKELSELAPQPGEEDELAEKRGLLMNSDKIADALNSAVSQVTHDKNIAAALRAAQRFLFRSKFAETSFAEAIAALEKAANEADIALAVLEKLGETIETDPAVLEKTEDRLFALKAAARKYNRPITELPAFCNEVSAKLQSIDNGGKNLRELEKNAASARLEYINAAEILKEKRQKVAKKMEQAMAQELKPLKMNNCIFKVESKELAESEWVAHGAEKISFLAETNRGSGFHPIGKIASGGELSRFMLALRVVLQGVKSSPVMIFDEADSGIGGAVADAVGARLAKLAEKIQVLAVTHLPQVAAYAETHLLVSKEKSKTKIRTLNVAEKKEELARMLAGAEITDEARAAAGVLIGAR